MMALNIPTYINLYGYGYHNLYEMDELVKVTDPRIKFAGTVVDASAKAVPATIPKCSANGDGKAFTPVRGGDF